LSHLTGLFLRESAAMKVTIYDGKYTVIQDERGGLRAVRHGEEWRDCMGDGLILALAQEVEELRAQVADLEGEAPGNPFRHGCDPKLESHDPSKYCSLYECKIEGCTRMHDTCLSKHPTAPEHQA